MAKERERSDNLAQGSKDIAAQCRKLYDDVERGYQSASVRATDITDYWSVYRCELTPQQLFKGRNRLYAPFVYEAIRARVTRFTNQLFPQSDRHVEASSEDGVIPRAAISVLEHYIADMKLREVVSSLFVSGDVEGQMNCYVDWAASNRRTMSRVNRPVELSEGVAVGNAMDVAEEDEPAGGPRIEVLSDIDICILPAVSPSAPTALASGGAVAIIRRWNERQIREMIDKGAISKRPGEEIIQDIKNFQDETKRDPARTAAQAAGIKKDGRGAYALIYEIWSELEIEDGEYRLCQMFLAGRYKILMARRNPYWCDKCPLFSAPVQPVYGSPKGISQIAAVKPMQFFGTDILNEMADSANYTQLPITRRDPAYITSPLVLAPGAVWDVPPGAADFAEMPPLWNQGMDILSSIKAEIFQVLSVNPAMVTQGTKRKLNQAEVAQEQQIDLLTTSDASKSMKDNILEPLINFVMELDYQYRDHDLMVRQYGEVGMEANLQQVPPFQLSRKTSYLWIGDELIRGQQQIQQKISGLNILQRSPLPPDAHYQLDLEPILVDIVEAIYGPRLGRLALKDTRQLMSVDPQLENALMQLGHPAPVRPMDNVQEHIPAHQRSIQEDGDPFNLKKAHVLEHQAAEMRKQQQALAQQQGMAAGGPAPAGPGMGRRGPRPGAQAGPPHAPQQPPGVIPIDQMRDARVAPRPRFPL